LILVFLTLPSFRHNYNAICWGSEERIDKKCYCYAENYKRVWNYWSNRDLGLYIAYKNSQLIKDLRNFGKGLLLIKTEKVRKLTEDSS